MQNIDFLVAKPANNIKRVMMSKKNKIFEELDHIAPLIPTPIYWLDTNFVIMGGNDECLKAIGSASKSTWKDLLLGKTYYDYYPKDIADGLTEFARVVLETRQPTKTEEKITDVTTGEFRYYETGRAPLFDYDGELVGTICSAIEITDKKEAEKLRIEVEANKAIMAEKEAERLKYENEALHVATTEQETFKKIVGQMMHDITSPISSINTIISKLGSGIPETDRVTLRSAAERIEGISARLLKKYENKADDENEQVEPLPVSLSLLQIMNEKKEEYLDSGVNFVVDIDAAARFCFIQHNSGIFKRMISNLVNNAVDALKSMPSTLEENEINLDSKSPSLDAISSDTSNESATSEFSNSVTNKKVTITLSLSPKSAIIVIGDNGPGMPQHIQDKFNQGQSVSEGKGEAGHGIGLTQVHDAITLGNGRFEIYASDSGTEINIYFPLVAAPHWIATSIKLNQDDTVLILDDDTSIHGAWDHKFATLPPDISVLFQRTQAYENPESAEGTAIDSTATSLYNTNCLDEINPATNPTLKIKHFTYGKDVIEYINKLTPEQKQSTFLLTDYELLEQGMNGLDVVEQTKMTRAILVTSYATNPKIQERVTTLGIRTLPKELVSAVEIKVDQKLEKASKIVDMVWVEDQAWYVDGLVEKHYSDLKVDVYYDPVSFMESIIQYPLNTRIILDTYYENADGNIYKQTGYDLAHELHALGYTKLILLAGEDPKGRAPEYLQVLRKKNEYDTENLHRI